LNFGGIATVIEDVLQRVPAQAVTGLHDVMVADAEARAVARAVLAQRRG